jgi:hypothetical protein
VKNSHIESRSASVLVSHGLGNQLFQLSFAHYLKSFYHVVGVENSPIFPRNYEYLLQPLEKYCTHLRFKNNINISHKSLLGKISFRTKIAPFVSSVITSIDFSAQIDEQPDEQFEFKKFFDLNSTRKVKYSGFWQHWKYLVASNFEILDEINLFLRENVRPIRLNGNRRQNLVIHIRRGDYLERGLDKTFGIIDYESYFEVISSLNSEAKGLNVITITNDYNLTKNRFFSPKLGIILTPDICDTMQALRLMSESSFVISANSTFSWWGAVLSASNGGIGFTPQTFFKNLDTKDAFNFPGLRKYTNNHY